MGVIFVASIIVLVVRHKRAAKAEAAAE
jgi:hypothetical protein